MGWSRELKGACAPDEKSYARVQSLLEEGSLRHSARVATDQPFIMLWGWVGERGLCLCGAQAICIYYAGGSPGKRGIGFSDSDGAC